MFTFGLVFLLEIEIQTEIHEDLPDPVAHSLRASMRTKSATSVYVWRASPSPLVFSAYLFVSGLAGWLFVWFVVWFV